MFTRQSLSGFTLIEVLAVMVVLAVLSIVIIPKYLNISSDANKAHLDNLESSLHSSLQQLRVICNIYEPCRNLPTWPNRYVYLPAYKQRIMLIGRYPEAGSLNREGEIHDLINTSGFVASNPNPKITRWSIPSVDDCYVQYKQIDGGETYPLIERVDTGC